MVNTPTIDREKTGYSFQIDISCDREVNGISFDYPLSECEDSLDAARQGVISSRRFYVSESNVPQVYILLTIKEKERHFSLLNLANTLSLGLIPGYAEILIETKMDFYNSNGYLLYTKEAKEKIKVLWHLIYIFHAPFLNPDAISRESIQEISKHLSTSIDF